MLGKYWDKKGKQDETYDYIVIGSGMGGMTAAAMLSKLGKKVLVLEQHYVPGGYTHTFKRKKYLWDVGVHAVGEVTEHSMTGRLLNISLTTVSNGHRSAKYTTSFISRMISESTSPTTPRSFARI